MNFADAIRQASRQPGAAPAITLTEQGFVAAEPPVPAPSSVAEAEQAILPPAPVAAPHVQPVAKKPSQRREPAAEQTADSTPERTPVGNHSVIRLEMFLTAEQISALFKSVATSQHSVLTLREASNHLRMNAHTLEELARSAEIPAFYVDGKWRFPKAGLDEWVAHQVTRKEAS